MNQHTTLAIALSPKPENSSTGQLNSSRPSSIKRPAQSSELWMLNWATHSMTMTHATLAAALTLVTGSATYDPASDITKLPSLNTFTARSLAYGRLQDEIARGSSDSGFMGAARDVTLILAAGLTLDDAKPFIPIGRGISGPRDFSPSSRAFLPKLSKELARINVPMIQSLINTGRVNGLTTGPEIDGIWVDLEQRRAEEMLLQLSSAERSAVIRDMDRNIMLAASFSDLASLTASDHLSTIRAAGFTRVLLKAAEVRDPTYGRIEDRVLLGRLAAMLNRKNDKLIPVSRLKEPVFQVRAGDVITLSAEGVLNPNANGFVCGPEGIPSSKFRPSWIDPPAPTENFGCLLAEFKPSSGRSLIYKVGRYLQLRAPVTGELRVVVNDSVTADNVGAFLVSVKKG